MIKIELEIDNHMAHGCSPVEYIRKYILRDAIEVKDLKIFNKRKGFGKYTTPWASILMTKIEQD